MKKFLLALVILISVLFLYSNFAVTVTDYEVNIADLPAEFDGYKILQLTDLHSDKISGLVSKIKREEPDIVVMTGDMISTDDESFDTFLSYAEEIADEISTYFVVGNHEQALKRADCAAFLADLADRGVYVLDNECVSIERANSRINLYGMWFNLRFYRDVNDESTQEYVVTKEHITNILGKPKKGVNILLTHNPVYFDAYREWGADLTLSGHMHGGMIRIPGRGGLFSPEKEYFPEFDGGLYEKEGSSLAVSRGLGQHRGFRFLNQPEILVITLKK